MNSRWLAATGCLVAALAMGVGACGDDDDEGSSDSGGGGEAKSVTIYSSLPLQGASRPQTTALVNGIKLALEQAGNKAGDVTVKYESLDDSTAQAGYWTPEATSRERPQGRSGRLDRRATSASSTRAPRRSRSRS